MNHQNQTIIKILGTAQDGGVPQTGCRCKNCQNAEKNPSQKRLVTCLALIQNNTFFLIDATPDIKEQIRLLEKCFAWEKPLSKLKGIFLTHAHIGHYGGLLQLGFEAANVKKVPLLCTKAMGKFLRRNKPWSKLLNDNNFTLETFSIGKEIAMGNTVKIIPFKVPHRDEFSDTVGFFIKGAQRNLFFLPDFASWETCGKNVFRLLHQADNATIDGTFFTGKEIEKLNNRKHKSLGHPPIEHSIQILKRLFPKKMPRIFFIHLDHSNSVLLPKSPERKMLTREGFFLAKEGLEFML